MPHLRWDFVLQRPQHLLGRAAPDGYRVIFFKKLPMPGEPGSAPPLETRATPEGVTMAVPHLRRDVADAAAEQRRLLDGLLLAGRQPRGGRLVAWFYTPMALEFAAHLTPDLAVHDCMDDLSLFRGAPPVLVRRERALLSRTDLAFNGGRGLFEAKRDRHTHVHCFPSSIDAAHFHAAPYAEVQASAMAELQRRAWDAVPYAPAGLFRLRTAFRADIGGVLQGPNPFVWNLRRG